MAYITVTQFLRLYDNRRVSQLLSDTGTAVASGDLATNNTLLDILEMASEQVAAAALVGERYTTLELSNLSLSSTAGYLLRRLVADLAYTQIIARRGMGAAELDRLCPAKKWCEEQLEMLRNGMHIFPGIDDTHAEAGLPAISDINSLSNPHRVDKFTDKANRLFPFDCNRFPTETDC